jgi:hypothetical protein
LAGLRDAHLSNVGQFAPKHNKKFFLTLFLKKGNFDVNIFQLEKIFFKNNFF